jgi:cystathionine gamma-lyase
MELFRAVVSSILFAFVIGKNTDGYHFGTKAVHAGIEPDQNGWAVVPPIQLATTYIQAYPGSKPGLEDPSSYGQGYFYSRQNNPTRGTLERALAAIEDAKYCSTFASGMAATQAVIQLLNSGDHVIASNDLYGGTSGYFRNIVTGHTNIQFSFVPFNTLEAVEKAITPKTKMIWLESPTNPLLQTFDIRGVAAIAKKHGCLLVVDGTFMSPYLQRPLELGADIVVHSLTKFITGHSDVLMGCALTNDETIGKKFRTNQNFAGAIPGPFDCYLAIRGMKTLHIRMEACQRNAIAVAETIEKHEVVERVYYPGLKSYPQYDLAKSQTKGPGAMMSMHIKGGLPVAAKFLQSLKIVGLAVSLGAVESLACSPALMTHTAVSKENREAIGLTDSLIRISIGIENQQDLVNDIQQALDAALIEFKKQ